VSVKRRGEDSPEVGGDPAGGGSHSRRAKKLAVRGGGDLKHFRLAAMPGNGPGRIRYQQFRVPFQICCRYYLMINMVLVVGEDMSSPAVKGMAKLGSAGGHFKFLWIRAETDRVSVGIFGEFGTSRIAGKNDLTPP